MAVAAQDQYKGKAEGRGASVCFTPCGISIPRASLSLVHRSKSIVDKEHPLTLPGVVRKAPASA